MASSLSHLRTITTTKERKQASKKEEEAVASASAEVAVGKRVAAA